MAKTKTTGTIEPGQADGSREFTSALLQNGPAQVGGMVTSVILVGQAFARFSEVLAPFAAFIFSFLLAIYQVWLVQKANIRQCCVIVPIAGLILFALALGSNNSIAPTPEGSHLKKELSTVREQLQLRNKELANAQQLIEQLRRVLNLPSTQPHSNRQVPANPSALLGGFKLDTGISRLFGLWVGEANAQPSDDDKDRQQAQEALRAYEMRQQELQQEQRRLLEEQERLRLEQDKQQKPSLWRKW